MILEERRACVAAASTPRTPFANTCINQLTMMPSSHAPQTEISNPRMIKLHEFLHEHGLEYVKDFTTDGEVVEMYLHPDSGCLVMVHMFDAPTPMDSDQEHRRSFELYVPATNSNKIDDTFDAIINHLSNL